MNDLEFLFNKYDDLRSDRFEVTSRFKKVKDEDIHDKKSNRQKTPAWREITLLIFFRFIFQIFQFIFESLF